MSNYEQFGYTERKNGGRKDAIKVEIGSEWDTASYGKVTVVAFETDADNKEKVRIRFNDTGAVRLVRPYELQRGQYRDHSLNDIKDEVYKTNHHGYVRVLNNPDFEIASRKRKVDVKFLDTGSIKKNVFVSHVKMGVIRDMYSKTVCGVGFIGEGKYSVMSSTNVKSPAYNCWMDMMKRCYARKDSRRDATYKEFSASVCEEWHNFQNFAEWFYDNTYRKSGWQLDKDFIQKGNVEYSPESCCFLPGKINTFFHWDHRNRGFERRGVYKQEGGWYGVVGKCVEDGYDSYGPFKTSEEAFYAYKEAKENLAKILADKFSGEIDPRVEDYLRNLDIQPQW